MIVTTAGDTLAAASMTLVLVSTAAGCWAGLPASELSMVTWLSAPLASRAAYVPPDARVAARSATATKPAPPRARRADRGADGVRGASGSSIAGGGATMGAKDVGNGVVQGMAGGGGGSNEVLVG